MSEWWFAENEKKTGPVSEAELRRLIQMGKIKLSTMVWQEGMDGWKPIEKVSALVSLKEAIPPPLPQRNQLEFMDYPLAKAWPRFFARTFDMWWESLLIGYVTGYVLALSNQDFVLWVQKPGSEFLLGMVILPVSLFFDAGLYSLAGNTPGKMLLGLKVTNLRGRSLEFVEYLMRNMSVWLSGLALGFPLINLFTMSNQHKRLGKGEQASYDDGPGYRVHVKPIGGLRLAGFSLLFFCLLVVMGALKK